VFKRQWTNHKAGVQNGCSCGKWAMSGQSFFVYSVTYLIFMFWLFTP